MIQYMLISHAVHRVPTRADCKEIVSFGYHQNTFFMLEKFKKYSHTVLHGLVLLSPKCIKYLMKI